jgi:hypothetical protein
MSMALAGIGFVIGRARRPAPPPLIIERRSDSPLSDTQTAAKSNLETTTNESGANSAKSKTSSAPPAEEDIYLCGARTKKGTPCSRRVHGPVRCWQHKGMPAMLPQEKLLVKG